MAVERRKVHDLIIIKLYLDWWELHHGYYGIVLIALGIALLSLGFMWAGIVSLAFGVWYLVDDIYQHWRQVKEQNPLYHSPVHNMARPIYKFLAWCKNK